MSHENRVVVTGLGVMSPLGESVNEFWDSLISGKSGIGKITLCDTDEFPNDIAGEVTGFDRVKNSEACELVSSLTGDNSREVVSFGTEAGLFQEIGISTVVCGPGSIEQAHKVDEFIELNELKKCLKFLDGIKIQSTLN